MEEVFCRGQPFGDHHSLALFILQYRGWEKDQRGPGGGRVRHHEPDDGTRRKTKLGSNRIFDFLLDVCEACMVREWVRPTAAVLFMANSIPFSSPALQKLSLNGEKFRAYEWQTKVAEAKGNDKMSEQDEPVATRRTVIGTISTWRRACDFLRVVPKEALLCDRWCECGTAWSPYWQQDGGKMLSTGCWLLMASFSLAT